VRCQFDELAKIISGQTTLVSPLALSGAKVDALIYHKLHRTWPGRPCPRAAGIARDGNATTVAASLSRHMAALGRLYVKLFPSRCGLGGQGTGNWQHFRFCPSFVFINIAECTFIFALSSD